MLRGKFGLLRGKFGLLRGKVGFLRGKVGLLWASLAPSMLPDNRDALTRSVSTGKRTSRFSSNSSAGSGSTDEDFISQLLMIAANSSMFVGEKSDSSGPL